MDNEAPKYASWIPETGGYVANGNVISKSPLYDTAGKLRLDVNVNEFGNIQPQTQPSQNTQIANQPTTNVGITTANTAGSNTDVNAPVTGAGAMAALTDNTAKTGGTISSPATYSPVAGETTVTSLDKVNKEYQDAVARGDYQGQINALVDKQRLTGQDYSTMIDQLTRARVDKIANQDALFQQAIDNAIANGDTELARQLMQQQNDYRNTVGYDNAMAQKQQYDADAQKPQYEKDMEAINEAYNQKLQEFKVDYDFSYMQAIKDIGNSLIQMLPNVLNFQYDPYTDPALHVAQGYAVSKVKEQMNATGMYYSSMTQSAITKAVAELVPVYQKMAREEAIQNFQLMQQTASFLMDLEQAQFNLWKGQLQLQWDANDERRKQIAAAIEASNARGYINNEEAALLGVAPGTESYEARKAAQAKQDEIEKERRKLQQDIIMADFNNQLAIEKAVAQAQLEDQLNENQAIRTQERDYQNYLYDTYLKEQDFQNQLARDQQQHIYDMEETRQEYNMKNWLDSQQVQRGTKGTTDKKGTYNVKELMEYYKDIKDNPYYSAEDINGLLREAAEAPEVYNQVINRIAQGRTSTDDRTESQVITDLKNKAATLSPSTILMEAAEYADGDLKTLESALAPIQFKSEGLIDGQNMFDWDDLLVTGLEGYGTYMDFYSKYDGNAKDMINNMDSLIGEYDQKLADNLISEEQYAAALNLFNEKNIGNLIETASKKYGSDAGKTNKAVNDVYNQINTYSDVVANSGLKREYKEDIIAGAYKDLIDSVATHRGKDDKDDFDYSKWWFNQGETGRIDAVADIVNKARSSDVYGKDVMPRVGATLKATAQNYFGSKITDKIE